MQDFRLFQSRLWVTVYIAITLIITVTRPLNRGGWTVLNMGLGVKGLGVRSSGADLDVSSADHI